MSNGEQCCALEICCGPAEVRKNLPAIVATHAGVTPAAAHSEVIGQLLDWMAAEGLTFAPLSFKDVIEDIVAAERRRAKG